MLLMMRQGSRCGMMGKMSGIWLRRSVVGAVELRIGGMRDRKRIRGRVQGRLCSGGGDIGGVSNSGGRLLVERV